MTRPVLFAVLGWVFLIPPAFGDTRDDIYATMQRCRAFPEDRTWLDCIYGSQQAMRAKLGLAPAPEFQQRLVPPLTSPPPPVASAAPQRAQPSVPPHRSASLLQIIAGTAPPVAVSRLASLQYNNQGAFIVTLENGQVWRQVNGVGERVRFKPGTRITIRPGALGSYNLEDREAHHIYKVELRS